MTSEHNIIPEEYSFLVTHPSESLGTEFKRWLDLTTDEHKAKIVKGVIALYNNNGGRLVIGLRDDGSLDPGKTEVEIREQWRADTVQEVVSKYISPPIEVATKIFPVGPAFMVVIEVPSGVRIPATASRQLGKIEAHDLFVRTTTSNHRYSSSKPTRHDWEQLIRNCMDNREADIGAFFRRHLGVQTEMDVLRSAFSLPKSLETRVTELLDDGDQRSCKTDLIRRHDQIGFIEIAIEIEGRTTVQHALNQSFLWELQGVRPDYSGWPPFVFIPNSGTEKPVVRDGGWEATVELDRSITGTWAIDFWRIEPNGRFYTKRSLQDDTSKNVEPLQFLDPVLHLRRITEVMAIGIMFCQRMKYIVDETQIAFAFRWTRLSGRKLWTWAHPDSMLRAAPVCHDDHAKEMVLVPASTPLLGLTTYVQRVGAGLIAHFEGYDAISPSVVESIVKETLGRRY